jgi:flavin-dependent dehydrogenase
MNNHYDIIICGAGLSGRLLAYYLIKSKTTKKILLIDKSFHQADVLLGYWESGAGEFDFLFERSCNVLETRDSKSVNKHLLTHYSYKYLYKNRLFDYIDSQIADKVDFVEDTITSVFESKDTVTVTTRNTIFKTNKVFSSIVSVDSDRKSLHKNFQYYRGYEIETYKQIENPIFMDFTICHSGQFRFGYLLPLTSSRYFVHIVDYKNLPSRHDLSTYLEKSLGIVDYKITREEVGRATLSLQKSNLDTSKVIYIGSAGGILNPATGYGLMPFIEDAKFLVQDAKRARITLKFKFFFFWMILFINLVPNFAKYLFVRINRMCNFDELLDFVDAKGGWKSICTVFKAIFNIKNRTKELC